MKNTLFSLLKILVVFGYIGVVGWIAYQHMPKITIVDSIPPLPTPAPAINPAPVAPKAKEKPAEESEEESNLKQTRYTIDWKVPKDVFEVVLEYRDHSNSIVFQRKFSVTPGYTFSVEGKKSND